MRAQAYDLVLNGSEIGGGTIRIHDAALQSSCLLAPRDQRRGGPRPVRVPPRGAWSTGRPPTEASRSALDRIVAILAGEASIREVIAFPKTAAAVDLMAGTPIEVDQRQLDDLHLRVGR